MARFRFGDEVLLGEVEGRSIISGGKEYDLEEVELLAPSEPSKVVCVGLNYVEHAKELKMDLPSEPIIFLKPPTAVIGSGAEIVMPPSSSQVDYEGELAVVMK
jgi:2-keto-4-pentenoate hydratase/2-oxohepta-3-ene-1,7-dioic acid hydratase in catechol pathway